MWGTSTSNASSSSKCKTTFVVEDGTLGIERIIGARIASKMALSSSSATMCLLKNFQAWMEASNTMNYTKNEM